MFARAAHTSVTPRSASSSSIAVLQPKLKVGAPGDRFEHEADSVADRLMCSEARPDVTPAPIAIQRKCSACEEEESLHRMARSSSSEPEGSGIIQRKCSACMEEETVQRSSIETDVRLIDGREEEEEPVGSEDDESVHAKEKPTGLKELTSDVESRIDSMRGRGRALDEPTRSYFSSALGHDFSRVRIHDNAEAAAAADAIQARAFTIGNDVMFGRGEYAPGSRRGRHLLAHELTHVVQQGAAPAASAQVVQRLPRHGDFDGERRRGGLRSYREAMGMHECLSIMGEDAYEYCEQEVDESWRRMPSPDSAMPAAPAVPPPPPVVCVPDRALTWADFTGTPPASTTFGAETHWDNTEETDAHGRRLIKAVFDGAASWVKPKSSGAANRAVNGCAPPITQCQAMFDALAPGETAWTTLGPATGCAAAFSPDTTLRANNRGECESVLGAECDRVALLNSARLLAHEQLHFDIACEIAKKGTAHLAATPAANSTTILNAVRTKTNAQTTLYDTQTSHGCNAARQATWVTNVAAGLTSVTIP